MGFTGALAIALLTGPMSPADALIDLDPPETTIDSGPPSLDNSRDGRFEFSSSEPDSTFECQLDGTGWGSCVSPHDYAGLDDGLHSFEVRATDAATNVDPSPASASWTVDATAPDTSIDSAPSGTTGSTSASIEFSSSDGDVAGFECRLDSGAWQGCSSPKGYSGLDDGPHSVLVRALDYAGNADPSPAGAGWSVDASPPDTTIGSQPSDPTNSTSASFGFSASEPATFECKLDSGSWESCDSPKSYSSLGEGSHTFSVRATDGLGNTDASPASTSWTIDLTAPTATINSAPPAVTNSTNASFSFSSSEGSSSFECKLDGGGWSGCTSPKAYSSVPDGAHTFYVRATDQAGTTGAEDSASWTVVTAEPETTIDSGPTGPTSNNEPSFTFSSDDPSPTFECRLDGPGSATGSFVGCMSPKGYGPLADGSYTFRVRATSSVGNTDSSPATRAFRVDTFAPNANITSAPAAITNSTSASFTFNSSDSNATFECQLDSGAWEGCSSPKGYTVGDGSHTFRARATDQAGNTGPEDSASWTVVTTAPDTFIDSGPSGPTADSTPSFEFSSDDPDATFQCSLTGPGQTGAFSSCGSPKAYPTLANGSYTFSVRARDPLGNTDPSPATRSFSVDTQGPPATIDSGPSGLTNSDQASFGFSSSESGATFQCKLEPDEADFTGCTSPKPYSNLSEGGHTFRVRALDSLGNAGAQQSRNFTVDTVPPDTTITAGPTGTVGDNTPTFEFTSSGGGVAFECRVDSGAFASCSSPHTTATLSDGPHVFHVRARDAAGNVDASADTQAFTVDTSTPETTITLGPSGFTNQTTAEFRFTSDDAGANFECSLDGAGFSSCQSPKTYTGLANGAHTFSVRAVDSQNRSDPTPATRSFTVDTTAPQTTITSAPPATSDSSTASFSFTSNESGPTFQCRLDDEPFGPCSSPKVYTGLADGPHTFRVRAIDAAGNLDQTEASRTWTIDSTLPGTSITLGPSGFTNQSTVEFRFSSDDPGASFECSLDGAAFSSCQSPKIYPGLSNGGHTFSVRAVDSQGRRDPTPDTRSFTVDTAAPQTTITSGPSGAVNVGSATFTFSSSEASSTFQCKIDEGSFTACGSPATYSLPDGAHTFRVRAIDPAGNLDQSEASRLWTIDTLPPTVVFNSPPPLTNDSTPTFSFSSPDGGTGPECSLDAATTFTPCSSSTSHTTGALTEGSHQLRIRVRDAAGNLSPVAGHTFTVDTTPPGVAITSAPPPVTNSTLATISFAASEAGSTFQCKLDAEDYAPCSSPKSYSALPNGLRTFRVKATDPAGNVGPVTTRTWTVNTNLPQTTIDAGPPAATSSTEATFAFSSNDSGAGFRCKLDDQVYAPCSSPKSYANLAPGPHVFAVKAVNSAGNEDPDPPSVTWAVDFTPPETTIGTGPTGSTSTAFASFSFSSEPGAEYECRLDGGDWSGCSPPKLYGELRLGQHTFEVRAFDAAGNRDPTPASRAWTIVAPPPPVTISSSSGPQLINPFPVVRISGTISRRGVRLRLLSINAPAGTKITVRCRGKRCPFGKRSRTAVHEQLARAARVVRMRRLERRFYPAGTKIEVLVTKRGMVGKYTGFKVRKGRPPARIDRCLPPGSSKPVRCSRA